MGQDQVRWMEEEQRIADEKMRREHEPLKAREAKIRAALHDVHDALVKVTRVLEDVLK